MKALSEIELQLSRLGIHNRFWGKPEIRELTNVLGQEEDITNAVVGRYEGGYCLLLTTNHRLLLVDKKIWFVSIEDIRFDMITEIDYSARLLDATISVRTINKLLRVTSIRQKNLRALTTYLQERLIELRMQTRDQNMQPMVSYIPDATQLIPQTSPVNEQALPVQGTSQQFQQIPQTPANRLSRIGAYPTSSLTYQRKFMGSTPRY